jgi:hypothetical protein
MRQDQPAGLAGQLPTTLRAVSGVHGREAGYVPSRLFPGGRSLDRNPGICSHAVDSRSGDLT